MEGERHGYQWTPEMFRQIENDSIFAQGLMLDSPIGYNLQGTENVVRWVAVKGDVEDWAIYYQNPSYGHLAWDFEQVKQQGDKLHHPVWINKLVPCDNKMRQLYRH